MGMLYARWQKDRRSVSLQVSIDHSHISASGLFMVFQMGDRERIYSGQHLVFVFEALSHAVEAHFPPEGFRVTKII